MTPHPDSATLAAFVDGRLSGDHRERVVEHLARCDDCHELVADVAHVLRDPAVAQVDDEAGAGEEEDGVSPAAGGTPLRPPASRFRRALPLAGAVAAAVLVALLAWTVVGRWILTPPSPATVAELTAPLPVDGAVASAVATVEDYGDVDRGLGGTTPDTERAFLLGLRAAELRLARAAGADAAEPLLLARLETLLADESKVAGPVIGTVFREPPSDEVPDPLAEADLLLAESLPDRAHWYALGRWAGVARVAAATGHREWFAAGAARRTLRALDRDDWPQPVAAELDAVAALARDGVDPAETSELTAALERLIHLAAGGSPDGLPS